MKDRQPITQKLGFLADNIEFALMGLALLIILLVPRLFVTRSLWQMVALTVALVAAIHGLILWIVRWRQHQIRQRAIADMRFMLKDTINNQLAVIVTSTYLATRSPNNAAYVARINETVKAIAAALDNLSDENLESWQRHYNINTDERTSSVETGSEVQETSGSIFRAKIG